MPDALPAVTVPSFANAGFSAASFSTVVPGARIFVLRHSKWAPLLLRDVDRRRSHDRRRPNRSPAPRARWLSAANASWSARETP